MIRPMRQRGFTIVEVLITIGIIAILLLFAAPSAGTWIQNTRLRSAAESVAGCLNQARLEAIKRNAIVSCQMTDTASTAWTVCVYDPINNICQTAAGSTILSRSAAEDNGITTMGVATTMSDSSTALASGVGLPGATTFDSFGRLASTAPNNVMRVDVRNTQITPSSDERRLVIYVTLGGQVRMCDPKLSLATNPMACQ